MPETPLETAQRIWPGAWEQDDQTLTLVCFGPPRIGLQVYCYRDINGVWWARVQQINGGKWYVGTGTLDHAITAARDRVQSMARDFARAAGVAL